MRYLSDILAKAGLVVDGVVTLNNVANATIDTDKFLVIDSGVVKYRSGTQMLSDIGAAAVAAGLPVGGTAGQILAKIDGTNYNAQWIDNYAAQLKHIVKLGENMTIGTPVYVSSADGTNMIISKASYSTEATSSKVLGLLAQGGVTNDQRFVITEGLLAGIDTSSALAGDPVWLGPNGTLLFGLANKPVAPNHMVYLGVVTRVQQNNGEIFVKVQNGFEIDELHDVLITSKANKDLLYYDSATTLWKNASLSTILGYTPNSGSGTTNYVTKWTSANALGNSQIFDNGTAVGIGTTTPDVNSTGNRVLTITGAFTRARLQLQNSDSVSTGVIGGTLEFLNGSNVIGLVSGATESTSTTAGMLSFHTGGTVERMRITAAGNVGIGTASPSYKVDTIVGTNGFDGYNVYGAQGGVNEVIGYRSTQGNGIGLIMGTTGAQATSALGGPNQSVIYSVGNQNLIFGTNSTSRMVLSPDGNLGLGMTPVAVSNYGVFNIKGRVVNQAGIIAFYDGQGDSFGAIQSDTNYGLLLANGQGKPIVIMTNSTVRLTVNNAGAVTVSNLAGTGTRLVTADANGTLGVSGLASAVVTGSGTINYVSKFTAAGTIGNSQIFDNGTSVGVGTSSPTAKLDVSIGNINLSNAYYLSSRNAANTANLPMIGRNTGDRVVIDPDGYGTNIGGGGSVLINPAGGVVGIGTTTPNTLLELSGAAPDIRLNRTAGGATTIDFRLNGNQAGYISSNSSTGEQRYYIGPASGWGGFHTFYTDNVERMRISSTGHVGIGVTPSPWSGVSPSLQLGVSPFIASTGQYMFISSNVYYNGTNAIYTSNGSAASYGQSEGNHTFSTAFSGTSGAVATFAERMRITSGGNVGVSTTSPSEKLHVVGNVLASDVAGAYPRFISTVGAKSWEIGYRSGTTNYEVREDGTTRLVIANGGNVGVGTTTPAASARLDVTSTTQGFLPPRMTATQRAAITSPAVGLVVYQTDGNEGLWIYTNTNGWKALAIVV